ncbi:ABC transporter efflux protein, DrrB family prot ein [Mycolicibacterium canariasense]|uniref:ABC transporter efflux protein, DrrB family prot ein n=1 Tax=Mycolicibacterium canariasense TaxID=228230 RepID=A0A100WGS9_MYCCR|nr:ABC transporter permease [Mycolicibacterium canariasense]MCV7209586.1 ABC transporter permease [Mycolicibacterium canariasense]ORU99519.1 ABC transporter [Mycolicibacterium canariasense]GAS97598.1 ABC transporter efflux protein, DrrB family prot ein [Mycolicibacterium canariasense]
MTALGTLTRRSVLGTLRDGDLVFAIGGPVAFFVCFDITLRNVIQTDAMSYPQYILPVIVVQAMIFTAMTTADRAARDHLSGMGIRMRSLPITALAPVTARMLSSLLRAVAALTAALVVGFAFGFGFHGGMLDLLAFLGLALLLSLALSLGADAMGSIAGSTEAAGQTLLVPQLLLVMLSTGIAPAQSFPSWLGPFVRNQPVSVIADTLRGLALGEHVRVGTSAAWCVGLLVVFGAIAVRVQRRAT